MRRRTFLTAMSTAPIAGAGVASSAMAANSTSTSPDTGESTDRHGGRAADDELIPAPDRRADEGAGPFRKMVIRGGTLVDGTGAEPRGPVDVVIVNDSIVRVMDVRPSDVRTRRAPFDADHEIDATGMFILPGFIDLHVHGGGPPKNAEAEYPYKLWLAHGVTTVRGVTLSSHEFSASEQERSVRNEIVAPRIFNYQRPGNGWDGGDIETPEQAREWVRWAADSGVDGVKLQAERPDLMEALLDEIGKHSLGSTAHLHQAGVEEMNAIDSARLGLGTVTHFYGHFESLLRDDVELFPPDYDYDDEQVRFSQVATWIDKIHPVRGPEWQAYLQEHLDLGTVFDPTFNIYVASRDVLRMRNAEWHDTYTLPSLMNFFEPSIENHGSYYWDWGTEIEAGWKRFYQTWFMLMKDYHDMGGRLTTGSDSGFIYQTYGFGYVKELEMLREAGLTPLEIIQIATLNGAKTLYEPVGESDPPIGTVEPGKVADLVITPEDPLANFKTLYGSGHMRLNEETDEIEWVGGVTWTIKDGVVYDAQQLRDDVAAMVDKQRTELGV